MSDPTAESAISLWTLQPALHCTTAMDRVSAAVQALQNMDAGQIAVLMAKLEGYAGAETETLHDFDDAGTQRSHSGLSLLEAETTALDLAHANMLHCTVNKLAMA
jgi:hypothetical protein